jgi:very-short-patch-repair endonuclease
MPGPTNPTDIDNAIKLYLSGQPLKEILANTGVSRSVFHRARHAQGIPPRQVIVLPEAEIVGAYEAGESEQSIANRYGVMRAVVRRHLKEAGVHLRTSAEANALRMSRLTSEEKVRLTEAAHDAVRGKSPSGRSLELAAQRREQNPWHALQSDGERLFDQWLHGRGLRFTPQKAIGPYNVDFAVSSVAVEILGGGWHSTKYARHALRSPYILDAGWHLLMVWNYEGRSAMRPEAADYLVAFLDEVGSNPTAPRQYRVIAGGGELLAARRREDDEFPLVPPPRGC